MIKTSTLRILDLHARGLCPREIASILKCRKDTVWSTVANRGMSCHRDPKRSYGLVVEEMASERRADALVLSGEPDRRACCYFVFGYGGTDLAAADRSGATLAEVEKFRRQMPNNWTAMGVGGHMV